jgi:hypothetical protein
MLRIGIPYVVEQVAQVSINKQNTRLTMHANSQEKKIEGVFMVANWAAYNNDGKMLLTCKQFSFFKDIAGNNYNIYLGFEWLLHAPRNITLREKSTKTTLSSFNKKKC